MPAPSNWLFWIPYRKRGQLNSSGTQGADGKAKSFDGSEDAHIPTVGYAPFTTGLVQVDINDIGTPLYMQILGQAYGVSVSTDCDAIAVSADTAYANSDWTLGCAITAGVGGATFYINNGAAGEANRLIGPIVLDANRTWMAYFPEYIYEFSFYVEVTAGTIVAPSYAFGEDWA